MPKMTRSHYNLVADATADIVRVAESLLDPDTFQAFRTQACDKMTDALTGTNSQFKADRFRARCAGQPVGR